MFRQCLALALLLATPLPATADVIDAAPTGFHIKTEKTVNATPEQVYAAFLDVHLWWDGEHSWFGDAANFRLEPRAGGCFCEISGDRSVLHMTVSYVDPGKEVRLLGGLGPLQSMGLSGAMVFRFETHEDKHTKIVHEYRVTGYAKEGLEGLAPVVDAVQTHQVSRLVAHVAELVKTP